MNNYRVFIYHGAGRVDGRIQLIGRHVRRKVRGIDGVNPILMDRQAILDSILGDPPLWTEFVDFYIFRAKVSYQKEAIPVFGLAFDLEKPPLYWVGAVPDVQHRFNPYLRAVNVWISRDDRASVDPKEWTLAHPLESQAGRGIHGYVDSKAVAAFLAIVDYHLLPRKGDEVIIKSDGLPESGVVRSAVPGRFNSSKVTHDTGGSWVSNASLIPKRLCLPSERAGLR